MLRFSLLKYKIFICAIPYISHLVLICVGKITEHKMFVMDSFALPVEGTETRVNAQAAAYEYMTAYIEAAKKVKFELSFKLFSNEITSLNILYIIFV